MLSKAAKNEQIPGLELFGWLPILGAVLLGVNDHYLKAYYPSPFTGKLSDVAGMLFFPFLLTASYGWFRWGIGLFCGQKCYPLTRRVMTVCIALSGAALALVNLVPWINRLHLKVMAGLDVLNIWGPLQSTQDATDLVALTILPLVWLWGDRWIKKRNAVQQS